MARRTSGSAAARRLYLSLYNWTAFYGWAQVLYGTVSALLLESGGGHEAVYVAVERPLLFVQTIAVMEILNSILGLVRSPVSATLAQIFERMYVTWGILWSFPEAQSHSLVTSLILSWSITEVIRYTFFGMREAFGFPSSSLLWLRYNTSLMLYPIGMLSEVGLILVAMPSMKKSGKYCIRMPNKWNFSFDYRYASAVLLTFYVPGFMHMYHYVLGGRRSCQWQRLLDTATGS